MTGDIGQEKFLANNGWHVVPVDSPLELRPGDVVLIVDQTQDDSLSAMVLRREGS
jgi:hypothetical protein